MAETAFLVPADAGRYSGGTIYNRRLAAGLEARGWRVRVHAITGPFPPGDDAARRRGAAVLSRLADATPVIVDGLMLAGLSPVLAAHAERLRLVALVHLPAARTPGLAADERRWLVRREGDALGAAARVVVTSLATRRALRALGIPGARIGVVTPGTDPAALHRGSGSARLRLLCVSALTRGKGHVHLIDALAGLAASPWELLCVGALDREPETAEAVRGAVADHGLDGRVTLAGEVAHEDLGALYDGADVFVLASLYESYGMALAEALARGLPIVATSGGGVAETVPADAALLVAPGDGAALAGALGAVVGDAVLRERLAEGARLAGARLPDWERAAARFEGELRRARLS